MTRAFLDTNVIVDYLVKREFFYPDAAIIMSLAKHRKIKLYAASMSFATASYLMAKHYHNDPAAIKLAISNFGSVAKVRGCLRGRTNQIYCASGIRRKEDPPLLSSLI